MTPSRRIPIAFIVLFFITLKLCATGANSETGPRHVVSAWNIYKGGLYLNGQGRFYAKHETFVGANQIKSGVTYWDSQISSSLYWGLTNHLQFGLTPIISQKFHTPEEGNDVPGDLLMNIKLGSLGRPNGVFHLALQLDARVPIGEHHNIPLQPYSADAIGFGGMGIMSFSRQSQTSSKYSLDFNVGYFNHNDADLKVISSLADTFFVEAATQELVLGAAARWSGKKIGLFAEVHGRFFLQQPPETVYTRENFLYLSPGIVYQFNPWIQVIAGADILLSGLDDETTFEVDGVPVLEKPWRTVPNLPDWRVNFGLSFRLKEGTPPAAKVKQEKQPKVEKVADDKANAAKETQPSAEEEKKNKKEKERDIYELEKRLRDQQKNPVVEDEEERLERMEAERQRMLEVLYILREAMDEREKEEALLREEELRKAEELRLKREAEAAAAKQDSLLRAQALQDSLAAEGIADSLAGEILPDSLKTILPEDNRPDSSATEVAPDSTRGQDGEAAPEIEPDEQNVESDSTLNQQEASEVPAESSEQEQEAVPDTVEQIPPETQSDPPPQEPAADEQNGDPPATENPQNADPEAETPQE